MQAEEILLLIACMLGKMSSDVRFTLQRQIRSKQAPFANEFFRT